MLNETKAVTFDTVNGRVVVVGFVWKWGPGFSKPQQKMNKPIGSQPTRQ
ncbi:hypothetical protein [Rheinheimera hassiensis]|nr:hypothetical protein [Rheinheimera hassiensis]